jgi:hypothetical protein
MLTYIRTHGRGILSVVAMMNAIAAMAIALRMAVITPLRSGTRY